MCDFEIQVRSLAGEREIQTTRERERERGETRRRSKAERGGQFGSEFASVIEIYIRQFPGYSLISVKRELSVSATSSNFKVDSFTRLTISSCPDYPSSHSPFCSPRQSCHPSFSTFMSTKPMNPTRPIDRRYTNSWRPMNFGISSSLPFVMSSPSVLASLDPSGLT